MEILVEYQEGTEARLAKLEQRVAELEADQKENRRRHSYLLKRIIRKRSA